MLEVYRREDGKWAWRLKAANGQIIATDGGQGFENREDAEDIGRSIAVGRHPSGVDIKIIVAAFTSGDPAATYPSTSVRGDQPGGAE